MKHDLEEQLFAINPAWFNRKNPRHSLMCFGFSVGDGWFPILKELLEALKPIAPSNFEILQVKEKFGGLRFYVGGDYSARVEELILAAETEASDTCETCGKPGKLRGEAWLATLCDECDSSKEEIL